MKRFLSAALAVFLCLAPSYSQTKTDGKSTTVDGIIELDKTVHDFGDVITGSGALTCEFKVKNISDKPIVIYNVAVSCGCTDVQWTREPIVAGGTGKISVSYNNTDGPYPFDKNVTAYFSGIKRPVVLKLRGVAREKNIPIGEKYPVHLGNFGLKSAEIKGGNLTQGNQKSDMAIVANIGKSPIKVAFRDVTPGMSISVTPNPIPAGATAKMNFTLTADRSKWGKTWYYATPVVDGVAQKKIAVWGFTKENFSDWTQEQKDRAAQPAFNTNTYNFGVVKAGTPVHAVFTCKNNGKSDFVVYKVDSDWAKTTVSPVEKLAPGKTATYNIDVDTSGMPEGENMVVITMTTNTPSRPLVNLFIGGAVKK